MNTTVKKSDRIRNTQTNEEYRVLHLTENYATLVKVEKTHRLDIITIGSNSLTKDLAKGKLVVVEEEQSRIVDPDMLDESARTKFLRNKTIADIINKHFAPDYVGLCNNTPKPVIKKMLSLLHINKSTLWRIINRYIRSGCKDSSLLRAPITADWKNKTHQRKCGKVSEIAERNGKVINDNDRKIMKTYVKRYLSNKLISLTNCYDDMINECYSKKLFKDDRWIISEFPHDERPSFTQFRYCYRQLTTLQQRKEAKMGRREFKNQKRPLTGTALSGVSRPGDIFELDACELDIAVVSETDRTKTVGSPVVYFMIDVYSKLIVAASISFDNNSVIAMTNCLASLVENREEVLASYGITLIPNNLGITMSDILPSYVKPNVIRTDHGSDFISKEAQRIASENGIKLNYASPATGSYKGIVERSFRSFQESFSDLALKHGTKEHNGRSKHNKQAALTIADVKKLMYHFIFTHNSTQHETQYGLTPDMVKNKITNIPAKLWRYGIEHLGNPSYITDKDQFLYSLLTPVKAKLTRGGIVYNKIRFIPDINNDADMQNAMISGKTSTIKIRIDPRNNSCVYYLDKNGTLRTAPMVDDVNHREIAGLTWAETEALQEESKKLIAEQAVESDKIRRIMRKKNKETVREAVAINKGNKSSDKEMRETRAVEKQRVSKELSFKLAEPPVPEKEPETNQTVFDPSKMTPKELEAYRLEQMRKLAEDDDL